MSNTICGTCGNTGEVEATVRVNEGGEWGDFTETVACPECTYTPPTWADMLGPLPEGPGAVEVVALATPLAEDEFPF